MSKELALEIIRTFSSMEALLMSHREVRVPDYLWESITSQIDELRKIVLGEQ